MNNLTKNDRCTLYFDGLPILANDFMKGNELKFKFESITTLDKISIPDSAIKSWDASEANNGSVMAYYQDVDSNGKYELYLAGDGSVIAPKDSSKLFGSLTTLDDRFGDVITMDLSKLDTSRVTNMSRMFSCMDSLTSLDLSNFDTSKVTDMSLMFSYSNLIKSLNLSSFDTSKVTNMNNMFAGMSSLTSLNLSKADFSKVTNYGGMFAGIPSSQVTVKTKDEVAKAFIDARLAEGLPTPPVP